MLLNREHLAWAAGIFEGEGCISLSKNCPTLVINMTDYDVLRLFYTVIPFGTLTGPHSCKNPKYKFYWQWRCSGTEYPQAVIAMFWSWLGLRRRTRATEVLARCHKSPRALQVINREKTVCLRGHVFSSKKDGHKRWCPECQNLRRRKPGGRGPYTRSRERLAMMGKNELLARQFQQEDIMPDDTGMTVAP